MTTRQLQTHHLAQQAIAALIEGGNLVEGVNRLFDPDKNTFRVGVLEQLGRLQVETGCDNHVVREHARELNDLFHDHPTKTTRFAAKIMRMVRASYRSEKHEASQEK